MLSVYYAMLKSAVSYMARGRQLPSWDIRLQSYCGGIRHYTRMLFPVRSDADILTIDFDKLHDWLQDHQMPSTELPASIGTLRELSIQVSDIKIDRDSIRGIGLAEQELLSLIDNEGGGSRRRLEYELLAPWGVYDKFGMERDSDAVLEAKPLSSSDERVILFFHGGSYIGGSPIAYREPLGHLLDHVGLRAFVIDYRLAPRHPFPSQLHDALIAFNYLCQQGFLPQNIVLLGDSAGGHICLNLLLLLRHMGSGGHRVGGMVLMSPMTHIALKGESLKSNGEHDYLVNLPIESPTMPLRLFYRPGIPCTSEYLRELEEPMLSPLNGSLAEFPPTLIQCGEAELLLDDIRCFHNKLCKDNPETRMELEVYPDMVHVFHRFLFRKESKQAFEAVNEFLLENI
ncbi:hypothetical protein IWW38_000725 [Coemansia aciculifera]|uniref:Uncharacterized protein n=1 Tax=Coemansia aciculifera TaxID=417176 RepID=A0ACC1M958_9FUNG|nr:hypothetical protein IWW38_000725 [Coemansia aciculifera]